MAKILVADDEELIRKLICDYLINEGHRVLQAEDGRQALSLFNNNKDIALCLLDIMMPEVDGWEVCRKIRETSGVPVMLVSARSQDFDQIMGFESGADDYVTKPFSLAVLMRRINMLLQRGAVHEPTKKPDKSILEHDGLRLDTRSYEVFYADEKLELTRKEYKILELFLESNGRVLSRSSIVSHIWGDDYAGDERTIDSHIVRLRTKLHSWGSRNILTVYGAGYKLRK